LKITEEVLANGEWIGEDRFRWKNLLYHVAICKCCGENCLTQNNVKECFCSKSCTSIVRNKNISDEGRAKQVKALLDYQNPYRFKEGHKPWNKGLTKETNEMLVKVSQKVSETLKGNIPWNKGKTGIYSEDTIEKIRFGSSGERSSKWKGGVVKLNIPLYETYAHQLEPYEQCRRNGQDQNILEVRCTYCGKWFVPTTTNVQRRIGGINGNDTARFYDRDSCKKECPIFGKQKFYKGQEGYSSREVQPELRKMRFELDNYECQKCGSTKSLHCHHYEGIWINPIESADLDMCITLCKKCHKFVHKLPGCSYYDMRRCEEYKYHDTPKGELIYG
jgi:hypothetical protein